MKSKSGFYERYVEFMKDFSEKQSADLLARGFVPYEGKTFMDYLDDRGMIPIVAYKKDGETVIEIDKTRKQKDGLWEDPEAGRS